MELECYSRESLCIGSQRRGPRSRRGGGAAFDCILVSPGAQPRGSKNLRVGFVTQHSPTPRGSEVMICVGALTVDRASRYREVCCGGGLYVRGDPSTTRWSVGVSSARFHLPAGQPLDQWAEAWRAADPGAEQLDGTLELSIPYARWSELAITPPVDARPEEIDLFRAQHTALGRLLGVSAQHVLVETVGHIGAPAVSFLFSVNGKRLGETANPIPFAKDGGGGGAERRRPRARQSPPPRAPQRCRSRLPYLVLLIEANG